MQQTITFQFTPSIMARDGEPHKDDDTEAQDMLRPGPGRLTTVVQDQERVGLLADHEHDSGAADGYGGALNDIADQPNVHWPTRIQRLEKPLKKVWSYMSPPLIGAITAMIIGVSLMCIRSVTACLQSFRSHPLCISSSSTKTARYTPASPSPSPTSESSCTSCVRVLGPPQLLTVLQCGAADVHCWRGARARQVEPPRCARHLMGAPRALHRHARRRHSVRTRHRGARAIR